MIDEKQPREKWMDIATDLVEEYRNLLTLKLIEQSSLWSSIGIAGILLLMIAMFVLLFASVGLAWWLGKAINDYGAAFLIVAGIYLVLFVAGVLSFHRILIPRIRDFIIKKMYEPD